MRKIVINDCIIKKTVNYRNKVVKYASQNLSNDLHNTKYMYTSYFKYFVRLIHFILFTLAHFKPTFKLILCHTSLLHSE